MTPNQNLRLIRSASHLRSLIASGEITEIYIESKVSGLVWIHAQIPIRRLVLWFRQTKRFAGEHCVSFWLDRSTVVEGRWYLQDPSHSMTL